MDLEVLIAEFIERREAGEEITPARFAHEYPKAAPELERRLSALASAEALFPVDPAALGRFGPYRVVEEIGCGGMGVVYEARHEETGARVALKVLDFVARSSSRMASRFAREGAALRAVRHPDVVAIEDIGTEAGIPWLAMELVEGEKLSRLVRAARLRREAGESGALLVAGADVGWRGAVRLTARLARAVEAAHAAGVLHRDIKPGNVIVRPDGRPVLLDFGLVGHEDSPTLTPTGELVGTPQYMAPEQARGERTDARCDVYALGVLLFELLTLRTPHRGDDPMEVLEAVWSRPAPPLLDVEPTLPAPLAEVVDVALAFDPGRRHPTAAALADDLERVGDGRPPAGPGGALRRFFRR